MGVIASELVSCMTYIVKFKMPSPAIDIKVAELNLRFGKLNGLAAAKAINDAPKEYLAFDRGILWRAVVLNPDCVAGEVKLGFVLAGDITGVIASSVAEERERARKALEGALVEKEEERRKWQSRSQKNADDFASYKAFVKTEYGPPPSAIEKGKASAAAGESKSSSSKDDKQPSPRSIAYGTASFNRMVTEMKEHYKANPDDIPGDFKGEFEDWPVQRFIRKAISESESAAWYMNILMEDVWVDATSYGKVVSAWMDFFESAKEGAVHGASKRVFSTLQQLKVYAKEAKNLIANYPKKMFAATVSAAKAGQRKVGAAFGKVREAVKDRLPTGVPKGFLGRMKARFISGGKGVKRLWKNVWEGETGKKGTAMKIVASITLLPFVSVAAFVASFIKVTEDPAPERTPSRGPSVHESIEVEEDRRESGSSYFRNAAVARFASVDPEDEDRREHSHFD